MFCFLCHSWWVGAMWRGRAWKENRREDWAVCLLGGEAPEQKESGQWCGENGDSRGIVFDFCFVVISVLSVVDWMVQICLSFYEVKNKQASWFSNKIERLYWEQWYINLNVAQHLKVHSSKYHHPKVVDPGGAVACFVCQTKFLLMSHSY